MMITQFQFTNIVDEDESVEIIPDFCNWLCDILYSYIDTKLNRRKIQLRIKYLYEVPWLKWVKTKYTDTQTILETFGKSLIVEQYRKGIWRIRTNTVTELPGTLSSVDRIIRFIEYGDSTIPGTGIITKASYKITGINLQTLWKTYCLKELGYMTDIQIITRR